LTQYCSKKLPFPALQKTAGLVASHGVRDKSQPDVTSSRDDTLGGHQTPEMCLQMQRVSEKRISGRVGGDCPSAIPAAE